jgi:diguanylate cyclase (GGDEF)-like protein
VAAPDPVTGSYLRSLLDPHLTRQLSRAEKPCAVFLFDVDFFKTVNDVYGHLRGDRVLRQLADRVRALSRPQDVLFRYGGDEFVLVLPETGRAEAVRLAVDLTDRIRSTEFPGEPPLHLSISLGVAVSPTDGTTPTALLETADRRNYLAKRRGRGGAVADDAELGEESGSRLWERDGALRHAHDYLTRLPLVGHGRLVVRGQPGAGHTRFLRELARLAALRGFTVVTVPDRPEPPPPPKTAGGGVLLLADTGTAGRVGALLDRWRARGALPEVLGLVQAVADAGDELAPLPELAAVELAPWSPETLRIWLRTALRGEPTRTLVNWFVRRTGGLPAAAERELDRLRARRGLVGPEAGGWTLNPNLLDRPAHRVRLPTPLTTLVGRERETEQVIRLLTANRLVTLVGAGGIGKTRLSLAAAQGAAKDFDDGVVFVPLAQTRTPEEVVEAIGAALDVPGTPERSRLATVTEHLAQAALLLVLDNFEQVLSAGPLLAELLAAAPGITALVTSREPLAVYGERLYRVPPLPLPNLDLLPTDPNGVALAVRCSPAVALFEQRANAANMDFRLTPASLPTVAELCHRLDGLPLAIELAAARTDQLTPAALLDRLGSHLDVLGEGPRDQPARHRTLRGTVAWSYALLNPTEQRIFTGMSIFVGGATATAVLAVVAGAAATDSTYTESGSASVTTVLNTLVAKNLLLAESTADGTQRYLMLNTIHACAAELLSEPAAAELRRRHLAYFAALAGQAATGMTGPDQARWAETLNGEYLNLRAALTYALAAGEWPSAVQLCHGLWRHWRNGQQIREGRQFLDRMLGAGEALSTTDRVALLYPAAVLAAAQDDTARAAELGAEGLALAERIGDREGAAQAHNILGVAAMLTGRYDDAATHFRYCLTTWRQRKHRAGTAIALGNLAKVALRMGDAAAANDYINDCLALERAAGNQRGVLLGLTCLAEILLARPDPAAAEAVAIEARKLADELGDLFGVAVALHQLGLARLATGDRETGLDFLLDALERRYELGDRVDLGTSLDAVAGVIVADEPALAVRLLAAVDTLRQRHGLAAVPGPGPDRSRTLATARAELGEADFTAAWRAGQNVPLDLIIDRVLDHRTQRRRGDLVTPA